MADPHQAYRAARHFASLDGLRGLSILPVIWHHCSLEPLPGLLGKGPAAVQLFFVLSGFLVTTLLLRERERTGRISLPRFYARRALRIFPLYYAVFLAVTVHTALSSPSPEKSHFLESWVYFATYTANWWVNWHVSHPVIFGFAWTLAIEEQFYTMWPPVLRLGKSLSIGAGFMLALLSLSQAVTWPEMAGWFPAGSFWRTFCLGLSSSIALGSLLAIALHDRRTFVWLYASSRARLVAPLLGAAALACLIVETHHMIFHAALTLWLAACVVRPDHGLSWLLDHSALRHIGRLSYALYLTHFIAVGATRLWIDPGRPLLIFLLALPLALVLAQLLHLGVERPFLRRKEALGVPPRAA